MVFSSLFFLFYFLPIFFFFYYIVPYKLKNYVLLIFSLFFYAWGEPIYIFLMIFSTFIDYINGRLLSKNPTEKRKKIYFCLAIIINLSLLCFFKYSNFFIEIVNNIFNLNIGLLDISLPIGISFYTFQTMSYSIDVYRGKVSPETNYFRYLAYVSMFPQLIAGPIVRYDTINEELHNRKITFDKVSHGFKRFLQGLFKKVLLANNIGILFDTIVASNLSSLSVLTIWLAIITYGLQIYYDFSGYSDMAIGLGEALGFTFDENFDYPYLSRSISEFWRRWHISLGSWFRDYLLYPVLKSNFIQKLQSKLKEIFNKKVAKYITVAIGISFVFFFTGLWHGANYNYIMWGLYYGFFLIIEEIFLGKLLSKNKYKFINHIYVLFVVIIGYTIFSIEDFSLCISFLKGMFGLLKLPLINSNLLYYIGDYWFILMLCVIFCFPIYKKIYSKFENKMIYNILETLVYVGLFVLCIFYLVTSSYNPFMYFRF